MKVFYHVAVMNDWAKLFVEQKSLMLSAGLVVKENILIPDRLKEYEIPTLQMLWEYSQNQPEDELVIYAHTKGISDPSSDNKTMWRKVMEREVITQWRRNVDLMDGHYDMVGCNWLNHKDTPHFSGNFWMARTGWIKNLISPIVYQHLHIGAFPYGYPWERICAEFWIASSPGYRKLSLVCEDEEWWIDSVISRHLT